MPNPYDPQQHHRRSIRLKSYDYTQPGVYFVTILAWHRQPIFGQIQAEKILLSPAGEIVWQAWQDLPRHFKHITLGNAVVMPNHLHGILFINGRGEAFAAGVEGEVEVIPANASPSHSPKATTAGPSPSHSLKATTAGSLAAIIQNFKSITSRKIARELGHPGSLIWQRNYYERVVRNEDELRHLSEYILNNPSRWATDEENSPPYG
jgi:putative transposase